MVTLNFLRFILRIWLLHLHACCVHTGQKKDLLKLELKLVVSSLVNNGNQILFLGKCVEPSLQSLHVPSTDTRRWKAFFCLTVSHWMSFSPPFGSGSLVPAVAYEIAILRLITNYSCLANVLGSILTSSNY